MPFVNSSHRTRYSPFSAISSSWFPSSMMRPSSSRMILSLCRIVVRRCATDTTVIGCSRCAAAKPCCTRASVTLSSADVASSSSSSFGLRSSPRAMATRCFCPPESARPL
mmetsp:Transcript_57643/g.66240  ORF Transcript_57643/g.66240 Transcript_57643/m.66240 type:complete len:110 (-) Transcript_57643:457-786(-)